jgi:hypothetical protein
MRRSGLLNGALQLTIINCRGYESGYAPTARGFG